MQVVKIITKNVVFILRTRETIKKQYAFKALYSRNR